MKLKCYTIVGIIFVLIFGTLSHFLYNWTGNNFIIGFFTPINESIWEHMKLLFFPMLLFSSLMIFKLRAVYPCITSSLYAGMLLGTTLIPILFYAYTYIIGKNFFIFDIAIFMFSVVIAFLIAYNFTQSCKLQSYSVFIYILVCVYLLCFLLFTYEPPNIKLFAVPVTAQH